jgi:vitamin K-dependent gamma-carboxylase
MSFITNIREKYADPISGLSLAMFRIMFGTLIFWDAFNDFVMGKDQIRSKFIAPEFHFKSYLFEWVEPWPELWMAYLHYTILMVASFCVIIGLYYRAAIVVTVLCVAWIFFAELAYYLNHYYLVIATGILMSLLPMNRVLSIDALRHPEWSDKTVPQWSLWSLRSFVEIVLVYAGLVKLNPDWLRLEPLRMWLQSDAHWHVFGGLLKHDWFIAMGAYGTIALHLLGAPLLFFKRTRLPVFFIYCIFHLSNAYSFRIGIFPMFTVAATLIFFDPDWPKQLWAWLLKKRDQIKAHYANKPPRKPVSSLLQKVTIGAVVFFLIAQLLLPMRPLLYPGNVAWTQEGHQYSWRMKLRSMRTMFIEYRVVDPSTGEEWKVSPRDFLTYRQAQKVGGRPEYILQAAKHLQKKWAQKGHHDVEVYVDVFNSLNGRKPQRYIDPTVDLTKQSWGIAPSKWILPLTEPLPSSAERGKYR